MFSIEYKTDENPENFIKFKHKGLTSNVQQHPVTSYILKKSKYATKP